VDRSSFLHRIHENYCSLESKDLANFACDTPGLDILRNVPRVHPCVVSAFFVGALRFVRSHSFHQSGVQIWQELVRIQYEDCSRLVSSSVIGMHSVGMNQCRVAQKFA
jgi:hypothetical protein